MSVSPADAPTRVGLAALLAFVVLERVFELALSARNARRLRARGGVQSGARHFPLLVAVHTLFPLALLGEVVWLRASPGPGWPLWLGLWLAAQGLRYWAIAALGESWNARIWVVPGAALVRRGPYRFLRHPNYLAVVIELIAAPLIFGAWRTAILVSLLNLAALKVRIRAEEEALMRNVLPLLAILLLSSGCSSGFNRPVHEVTALAGQDGVQHVRVVTHSFWFEPNRIVVRVGVPVDLELRNGSLVIPHNFTCRADSAAMDLEVNLGMLKSGKHIRFTPQHVGEYHFFCDHDGHAKKGMTGTPVVRP